MGRGSVVDRSSVAGHEGGTANDAATLLVRFGGGVDAVIDVSAATPVGDRHMDHRVRIEGEAGVIECDQVFKGRDAGVRLRIAHGTDPFTDLAVPDTYLDGVPFDDAMDYYLTSSTGARYFADCLIKGVVPTPTFRDGAHVQDAIDAAMLSASQGRRVALPAQTDTAT